MIMLHDSNFSDISFWQEVAVLDIAASVMEWQHVKLRTFKLIQREIS